MKVVSFLLIFLVIGALFIISENNLALKNQENRTKFLELYFIWLSKIFENSKNLVGYVVKLDWLPENKG